MGNSPDLLGRDSLDGLEHAARDLVRVALGVRTTILKVALVLVVHEAVGHADRGTAIGDSVAELVDRLGLVESGQTEVVVRTVNGDVLVLVLIESGHELLEVLLATLLTHELGGEVAVHAGSVPIKILTERFAVELDVDAVLLTDAHQDVAGEPDFIGGLLGALAEDLEFPLALGHFGIDALVIDSHLEADIEVLLDDLTGDVTDGGIADSAVELALRLVGPATLGETEGLSVPVEEILLLESEPGVGIIEDRGTGIGRMRLAVGEKDLAHDEVAVLAGRIDVAGDGLEQTIGAAPLGLAGRAAVKSPHRQILERGGLGELLDGGLAAEVGNRLVTVEPDVFEFVLGHDVGWLWCVRLSFIDQPTPSGPTTKLAETDSKEGRNRIKQLWCQPCKISQEILQTEAV